MKNLNITKQVLLLLLIIIGGGSLKAQVEFAPVGTEWNVLWQSNNAATPLYVTESLMVVDDTVVDGLTYMKLLRKLSSETTYWQGSLDYELYGLLREDVGKVFYKPINQEMEFLLYDFCMNVNDTAVMYYCQNTNNEITVRVDSITTEHIAGADRRIFHISCKDLYSPDWMQTNTWVEGIGDMAGLLYSCHPVNAGGITMRRLLCYHEDDNLLFIDEEFNSCEVDNNVNYIEENETDLAYFDYLSNTLYVTQNDIITLNITIYDIHGRVVFSNKNHSDNTLDLSFLSNGFYIISIENHNKIHSIKIVKS